MALEFLNGEYGGFLPYLTQAGISAGVLEAVRDRLVGDLVE